MIDSSLGMEVKLKKKRRAVFPLVSGSSSKTSNLIKQVKQKQKRENKSGTETSSQTPQSAVGNFQMTANTCDTRDLKDCPAENTIRLVFPFIYASMYSMKFRMFHSLLSTLIEYWCLLHSRWL